MENRRTFIKKSGTFTLGSIVIPSIMPSVTQEIKEIGIQIYSVRNELKEDLEGTLKQIAKMKSRVLDFAMKLDQAKLESAKLFHGEIIDLLHTLSEFLIGQHEKGIEHLERLHSVFSNKDNFYIELYKRTGKIGCLYHIDKSMLLSRVLGSIKRRARGYLWA